MASTVSMLPTISPLDLKQRMYDCDIHIIDVRELDYFVGHIPGSRHIPSDVFADEVDEFARAVSTSASLCVVTCLTGEVRSNACALQLVMRLTAHAAYREHDVRVLKGGFMAWERHFMTKNAGGHHISRSLCLDEYSHFGLPIRKPSRNKSIVHAKYPRWHVGRAFSYGSHDLSHKGLPVDGVIGQEAQRGVSSVGDVVRLRDCGSGQWVSGIIADFKKEQVVVRFARAHRSCVTILPLGSPDLQRVNVETVPADESAATSPTCSELGDLSDNEEDTT